MDMNAVRLCFQCELEWDDGRKDNLSPVVSNPIYDKSETSPNTLHRFSVDSVNTFYQKRSVSRFFSQRLLLLFTEATTTSQLKITCLNLSKGSCLGKTEIYMLCDKVQKGEFNV